MSFACTSEQHCAEQTLRMINDTLNEDPPQEQHSPIPRQNIAIASPSVYSSRDLAMENVMPGIFLAKNFIPWNEDNLRAHGFTHIIIIDKHIQELYYPSPIFKLAKHCDCDPYVNAASFEYFCPPATTSALSFGKEFEAIELNFGEKSYLTTVLPNCYRAVKFINKALQTGGAILVIDCNGGEQKCLTITVAYLMYKHNISFSNAFARLKCFYKKADLDRFYMSQLYEYEPILQVQRAQSRGQSCSRKLHAAILKRKKLEDDTTITVTTDDNASAGINDGDGGAADHHNISDISTTSSFKGEKSNHIDCFAVVADANDFFNTLNPLSQFKTTQQAQQQERHVDVLQNEEQTLPSQYASAFNNICEDYAME